MWLQTEHVGDVVLWIPSRLLFGGPDMDLLETAMDDLIAARKRKVILDLKNVEIFTSLAIRRLLSLQVKAKEGGVSMCLCQLDRIAQVPARFWLGRLFRVFDSREECLRDLAVRIP